MKLLIIIGVMILSGCASKNIIFLRNTDKGAEYITKDGNQYKIAFNNSYNNLFIEALSKRSQSTIETKLLETCKNSILNEVITSNFYQYPESIEKCTKENNCLILILQIENKDRYYRERQDVTKIAALILEDSKQGVSPRKAISTGINWSTYKKPYSHTVMQGACKIVGKKLNEIGLGSEEIITFDTDNKEAPSLKINDNIKGATLATQLGKSTSEK